MKTKIILMSLFMTTLTFVNGQNTTTTDKSTSSTNNCDELKKENESLKNSLKISEPIKIVEQDDLIIKLISAKGNIKTQTIKIEYLITNKTKIRKFNISGNNEQIVSIDGDMIPVTKAYNFYEFDLTTDVPIKATIEIGTILPSNTIIKLITMKYIMQNPYVNGRAEFRDIPVEWK